MPKLLSVSKWLFFAVAAYYAVIVLHSYYGVEEWVEIDGQIWTMLEIREGLMFASVILFIICDIFEEVSDEG